MMKIGSLRFKINAAILVIALLSALIVGAILYPFEIRRYNSYEKNVFLLLDSVFNQRKDDLANELFARQKPALAASLKEMLKVEGIVAVTVYLPDGEVFLSTNDAFAVPMTQSENETASVPFFLLPRYSSPQYHSLGVYSREIGVIGMHVGYIRFYYDFARLERETRSSIMIFVTLLAATLFVMSSLLNVLLSRFVTRPISLLHDAIQKIQEGRLGETVHLTSRDEIGDVGRAFNEMSFELQCSQAALQQAEEKYRGIFENANEGLFQTTPEKSRYLTVNPSMVRMLGYDSQQELLSSVTDIARELFVSTEEHEEFERVLGEQGHIVGFETQLCRKDGSVIRVSASARRVHDESGSVSYYEGSFVDVTERREKEKAERERKAALAASKAKSEFLANMSHEIRTPMNAILGFTSLLGSSVTDPQQKNYVQSIQSSGKSLLSIINDILDLSKIEAGKMEIQSGPVCLSSVFEELQGIFSLSIHEKGLKFAAEIAPDIPHHVLLDEVRLRQVLFNLVGNAVKFTEDGWIRLSASKGKETDGGSFCLVIAVEDTGIGIPPEAQEEIFESFKQQSGQNAKLYGGTGLGLTISKSLVEMMGGSIFVRSQAGSGSVFEIHLPDVSEVPITVCAEPMDSFDASAISLGRGTVLVVDDTELNRKLVREFLQNSSIKVIEAENGQVALEAARQYNPDLVLMDIRMPVMDGYEALRRMRRSAGTRSIPIVALTASAMREEIERIEKSGFDGWLLRPFNKAELLKKLAPYTNLPETMLISIEKECSPGSAPAELCSPLTEQMRAKIVPLLENELMECWETVRRKQRITDIEDFGRQIKELGDQYGVRYLSAYGENLLFHAESFDIENIRRALDAYPEFVAGIEVTGRQVRTAT